MSPPDEETSILPALRRMGLVDTDELPAITPLSGGVSSLIARVDTRRGPLCVKQALPALKVASLWQAPQTRSHAEVAWIREVSASRPQAVPVLLGEDAPSYSFAMGWLPPEQYPVWKNLLRDGRAQVDTAARVASLVAGIHARTADDGAIAARFAHDTHFFALRLDPYFGAAASAHPECAAVLHQLIAATAARKTALVHGDISPKNILVGPGGPVILDAECAWYGDPAFDAAFCLTHLLAKCLWRPAHRAQYLAAFDAFFSAYLAGVNWEAADAIDARIAGLLAATLLARVDGKSPLEYLGEGERAFQRQFARRWLMSPQRTVQAMRDDWLSSLAAEGR